MSETRTTTDRSPIPVRTAAFAAALGAWILWSGVFLTGSGPIIMNNVLAGAAIAAFAAYTAGWPDGGPLPSVAAPALAALLGLWVLAAPFVLEVTADRLLWSNVIAGALVAILAGGSIYGSWQLTQARASGA
ncbi:SPW repeat domain-containing protein [Natronorubrum texcoconense]|uniref:SPW repeat-containing protein n=1 Tax=Natronorubrum texcoconense TaxID=1095776 RepID=A0A1G9E4U5_9EURY|nr:SPW repeat protein [Natronorubrum texcoconense]SDK71120.1 SPW repeat-containing protein [Natronorubrum texcoconense]